MHLRSRLSFPAREIWFANGAFDNLEQIPEEAVIFLCKLRIPTKGKMNHPEGVV